MNPRNGVRKYVCYTLILLLTGMAGAAYGQTAQTDLPERLREALELYLKGKPDDAIKMVETLFQQTNLQPADSIALLECLSVCTFAKGVQYQTKALEYLDRIASVGPCINPLPKKFWPTKLADKWYSILRAQNVFACQSDLPEGFQTIAFMPFDNYSVGEYQESLGRLSHAMTEFMCEDFSAFSDISIVERRKINFLLKEHEMSEAGLMDPATAVETGKIAGAQLMVFGSITQIDKNTARMIVKVVDVETSKIITSVSTDGKPDYGSMEKELVEKLAEKLELTMKADGRELLEKSGTENHDAMYYYGLGLELGDKYDYSGAYENFKKACDLDADFAQAREQMKNYFPLKG